jgi:hypothetical protein
LLQVWRVTPLPGVHIEASNTGAESGLADTKEQSAKNSIENEELRSMI